MTEHFKAPEKEISNEEINNLSDVAKHWYWDAHGNA